MPTATCSSTGWEKIGGVKPETVNSQAVLFSAVNSNGITSSCFERCERVNCTAFVVDFARSVCYSVETEDDELVPEANSTYYHRVCVKVPASCKRERLWQVERTAGAVFLDPNAFHLPRSITRNQCYEICIDTGRSCESAQFRTSEPLSSRDAIGRCSLSLHERGTRPQAYRASMYRDEYLRDQCRHVSKREYCSYAEFRNASLPYSDVALINYDEKQCERSCDSSGHGFLCRGYTLDNSTGESICLLHSEDTNGLGVSSLIPAANAIYREREPCLDLQVRCNETTMTIELRTNSPFFGRIYATGHADSCGADGRGMNRTVLTLPLPRPEQIREIEPRCGLNPAFSVDNRNRTRPLVWTTIVVQFNPILQRLGDQAVRVGCSLNDREPPEPKNVTIQSSFSFLDPNAGVPPISSTIVNASSEAPTVTMRILDENSKDAVVTHLGQKLLLKIELKPANGPYDIAAGDLVASSASGDASSPLLDKVGCPIDPTTFPPLSKDPADGRSLIATFAAFKIPNSLIVRFNVIVRFCAMECVPAKCNGDVLSYGKRKRETGPPNVRAFEDAIPVGDEITPDQLPLQISIIVHNPVASSADRLSSREKHPSPDTVLITGANSVDGLFCVNASLALSLLIFWLIIQILLIVGCLLTISQYRRAALRAEEERINVLTRHLYGIHGGNFEIARRVRWADHNASTSSLG
ncbi:PREDICTED: uncharacterized protein LOC107189204 [Dufourea novaeangliae]|uniref:ZP domain-containing protein n=1 Tax=Dufourea novaeangliae TaxID=178035 RepID=A0A154PGX2_DUFNO|nr:PREDICTED: uncharacterized protein LOC107189204 [Dufourea novaeangliae]KZC11093.1 hypothetical protein WN55_02454 [Dufourea novaeangliae]